jgi:5-methylcytosine-specific restriction endonuclease McrA
MTQLKRTLVIDATGTPVDVVDWQKAILLILTNKAKIIYEYDDQKIHSAYQTFNVPSILQLMGRNKRKKSVAFSRKALFFRDNYCCAYCEEQFSPKELTLDHVTPYCQGGKTNWENIVAACFDCNIKKGGNTPEQAKMPLKFKPYTPKWNPAFFIQLKKQDPLEIWEPFFGTRMNFGHGQS